MSLWNTNVATKESWLRETNKKTEFPCKLTMDGSIFCKACEMLFRNWNKKSKIQSHVDSQSHKKNLSMKASEIITRPCWKMLRVKDKLRSQNRMCSVENSVKSFFQLFYVTQMSPNGDFDVTKSAFLMSPKCHQMTILMSPAAGLWL